MEYTIKDKLLALIFPAVCALYGLLELRIFGYSYKSFGNAVLHNLVPTLAILGGVISWLIAIRLKVDFVPYLKALTIGTVIAWMLYMLIVIQFIYEIPANIFHMIVLVGAVFLMTVKMPDEAAVRDRLLVTFANPVLYSLLNKLFKLLLSYLYDVGALAK